MRAVLLVIGLSVLPGCDAILGIGDHEFAGVGVPDAGTTAQEGADATPDAGSTVQEEDAGNVATGEAGAPGCPPCILGRSAWGQCCLAP